MTPKEIKNIIISEIENLSGAKVKDLDEDIFLRKKYIDSLNTLNLIVFLEQKFDITVDAFFLDREAVDSVNALAKMIQAKLKEKGK